MLAKCMMFVAVQVRTAIKKAKHYKLKNPNYRYTDSFMPTGGRGSACTEHPVVSAYGQTPQLLVRFLDVSSVRSLLVQHLDLQLNM